MSCRAFLDALEEYAGVGIEAAGVGLGHQLTVRGHVPERLAQVVSRHRDELFKVRVRPVQLPGVESVRSRLPPGFGQCCPLSLRVRRGEGMVNLNVAPRPASDSTQIRPPWRSTTFLQIARPMPVPGISLPCRRLNMPNTRSASCGSMPIPLSRTANSHPSPSRLRRDMDSRCFLASVLDRIGNEVLEKLHQHNLFGHHSRQRIGSYHGAALRDGRLEIEQRLGENSAAIDRGEAVPVPAR